MKFATREDIEAPIDHVWGAVTDIEGFEKQAMRRGADLVRVDTLPRPGVGAEWDLKFQFRGKMREIESRLVEFEKPHALRLDSKTGGLEGDLRVELVALSPRKTRLAISLQLKPSNLSGRLLVQSLKFARGNLQKRFADRVYAFGQQVVSRYKAPA